MKQLLSSAAVLLLMLGFCIHAPVRAVAQDDNEGWTKSELTVDLNANVINACSGDDTVHITGSIHVSYKFRTNNDGSQDSKVLYRISGDGGATSGARDVG